MKPFSSVCEQPVVLTIAGSDSGGGAGIQADLKTFTMLGVFGTSAITCLTAQNPDGVFGIEPASPDMVRKQIRAVCDGFPVAAVKTGMLYSADLIEAVVDALKEFRFAGLVVDPVMVSTSGARLLRQDAVQALVELVAPLATVLTPNLPEASILLGRPLENEADQLRAARELAERFGTAVVVKGGHSKGPEAADVLIREGVEYWFRLPRFEAAQTHGTGCTFSAALAAHIALGRSVVEAVGEAKCFVSRALMHAPRAGRQRPLGFREAAEGELRNPS